MLVAASSAVVSTPGSAPLQLLPAGFSVPPLPYTLALIAGVLAVAGGLYRLDPPYGERHVLAVVPWMVTGSASHVLYVVDAVPAVVAPLFGTPSVYVTTAVVGGAVWLAAAALDASVPRTLAVVGTATATAAIAATLLGTPAPDPLLPALGLLVGGTLGYVTARVLDTVSTAVGVAGRAATLAVVAHGVDGVTTAVGVDLLGFGERTPLSAAILELAAALPTASLLGSGWLFVIVKLAVAALAVVAVAPTVHESRRQGYGLLTLVAAVGLGPGVHNALLFTVA